MQKVTLTGHNVRLVFQRLLEIYPPLKRGDATAIPTILKRYPQSKPDKTERMTAHTIHPPNFPTYTSPTSCFL